MSDDPLDILLIDEEDEPFSKDNPQGLPEYLTVAVRWAMDPPKLAIPLLSAQAKAAGHSVASVYRPLLPWQRKKFRRFLLQKPLVAGITTVAMFRTSTLDLIIREIRSISPETIIALGGHGAQDSPDMRRLGNVYITDHGEGTLANFITAVKGGADIDHVPGVSVSHDGCRIMKGSLLYENITRVLYPDWSATGTYCRRYPIEASRGCRFNCSYCGFPGKTSQLFRGIDEVVGEMLHVKERYHVRSFDFVDSCLTSNPEFILALCAALRKHNFRPDWRCFARPDAFDRFPELAEEMSCAGCSRLFMGVESIHDHILSGMRRGMNRSMIETGLSRVFKSGIKVHGNFIIGFPGETQATVRNTAEFIIRRPFSTVYLCTFGMSQEMLELAAAQPERYGHLSGKPVKGWRHDGMDYQTAYKLTLWACRKINWTKLWFVAFSPTTNNPDYPPF
ncbi:MAG: radical SAM protein [Elusimicrobia bacterium]|nr:radical SAM protein [Elusimicrobiota bacterium]